jgi:surfeit locus 1 family protein
VTQHTISRALRPKLLAGLLIPLACAALFVRLGVWQVARHNERAAFNAGLAQRLAEAPIAYDSLPADTTTVRWRRVSLQGRFRYDLEQVLAGRASEGSPGVYLITPLERAGNDTLVAVTRGWAYSADAATVDRVRWREGDTVTLQGYALPLPAEGPPPPADSIRPLRVLSRSALRARIGTPISMVQVVMTSDSAARSDSVPRRLPLPVLDAGPHRSYALQWFSFAAIAVVGGLLLFRRGIVAGRTAV